MTFVELLRQRLNAGRESGRLALVGFDLVELAQVVFEVERLQAALLDIASGCDACNSEDAQRFSAIARKALQ